MKKPTSLATWMNYGNMLGKKKKKKGKKTHPKQKKTQIRQAEKNAHCYDSIHVKFKTGKTNLWS